MSPKLAKFDCHFFEVPSESLFKENLNVPGGPGSKVRNSKSFNENPASIYL